MSQDSIVSAASGKSAGRSLLTSPHFNDARFVAASDKHNAARMSSFIIFREIYVCSHFRFDEIQPARLANET